MEAFYDRQGELFATSKQISLDELPVHAKRVFAKSYAGYNVIEAIQFTGMDQDGYFISAENDKFNVVLKVDDSEQLNIFKRTRK